MGAENIHTPERLEGESPAQYRLRKHLSSRIRERTTLLTRAPSQVNRAQRRAQAKAPKQ